jgi:hypothetical protein
MFKLFKSKEVFFKIIIMYMTIATSKIILNLALSPLYDLNRCLLSSSISPTKKKKKEQNNKAYILLFNLIPILDIKKEIVVAIKNAFPPPLTVPFFTLCDSK